MAATIKLQRRKKQRTPGDRRVVRVETKDNFGNPRYVTADLLDSSDIGLGIALRTPLEAGATIVVRTNLDPARPNLPRRVRVTWCQERPDGAFHAGLEFIS